LLCLCFAFAFAFAFLSCHPSAKREDLLSVFALVLAFLSLLLVFAFVFPEGAQGFSPAKSEPKRTGGFSPGPSTSIPFIYHHLQLSLSKTAQKTLVKPQNHLNHYHPTTSI
jgi:hypothetical protein